MMTLFENVDCINHQSIFILLCLLLTLSSYLVAAEDSEANALLKWKASLDNHRHSQALLSSWTGTSTTISACKWEGVLCDESNSVYSLSLANYGLKGTLHTLTFSSLPNLKSLDISNNSFYGTIPPQIGNLTQLIELNLFSNNFSGSIPASIGNLVNLTLLSLSSNQLTRKLPKEIGLLQNLEYLYLAGNEFNGTIPKEVVGLPNLLQLNLSNNKIEGSIPSNFGSPSLVYLDLSDNSLSGTIPTILGGLHRLELLNISCNDISGTIPSTFALLISLNAVNISNNQLEGPIPNIKAFLNASMDSLKNNKGLCGNVKGLMLCPTNRSQKSHNVLKVVLFFILDCLALVFCMMLVLIYHFCRHKRKNEIRATEAHTEALFSIWSYDGKMMIKNIIEATDNFDDKCLIGVGRQGCVYKAELPAGQVVAVKKLHSVTDEEISGVKVMTSEIQTLTEIKHRNIIKLYGFCLHSKFSFLVYDFLERGNLDQILKEDTQATAFDWEKRVNVVKGVANALSYMHHDCSPPIIHHDISSKNVLLDLEYEAHVSDFGTAKFLYPGSHTWSAFAGTFGYAAPELAEAMKVNEKCDAYSFGVLALEIIMGKHPRDLISLFMPPSLVSMANNLLLIDTLDQRLPQPTKNPIVGEVILIAKLGLACLSKSPRSRPTMKQVSKELGIGKSPLRDQFPTIRLGQLH